MDIEVTMTDEDGRLVDSFSIYQDGSDSEGCETIRKLIGAAFTIEEDGGECRYCIEDAKIAARIIADHNTGADDMISEGGPIPADQVTDVWKDEDRSNCVQCRAEKYYGVLVEHDCPYQDESFEPYENDEDDGQPDEAKEWYDYDPDC